MKIVVKNDKDLKFLSKQLKLPLGKALMNNVAESCRAVMEKHVEEDVYNNYITTAEGTSAPVAYRRRYDDGGLMDRDNFKFKLDLNGKTAAAYKAKMIVTNETPRNPRHLKLQKDKDPVEYYVNYDKDDYLAPIVEYGRGYEYTWDNQDGEICPPRPFMRNTELELQANVNILVKDIEDGLKAQGYGIVKRRW